MEEKIPVQEIFEHRRQNDPQGLIDDLLKQSARQAKRIHELEKELESRPPAPLDLPKKGKGKK